jgi:hypothetical protein
MCCALSGPYVGLLNELSDGEPEDQEVPLLRTDDGLCSTEGTLRWGAYWSSSVS